MVSWLLVVAVALASSTPSFNLPQINPVVLTLNATEGLRFIPERIDTEVVLDLYNIDSRRSSILTINFGENWRGTKFTNKVISDGAEVESSRKSRCISVEANPYGATSPIVAITDAGQGKRSFNEKRIIFVNDSPYMSIIVPLMPGESLETREFRQNGIFVRSTSIIRMEKYTLVIHRLENQTQICAWSYRRVSGSGNLEFV